MPKRHLFFYFLLDNFFITLYNKDNKGGKEK